MGIEIEKKYRLAREQEATVRRRLLDVGAVAGEQEFEVNTLYGGHGLDPQIRVLRLRRVGIRAILTFKERYATESAIKHQREDETEVSDPDALAAILDALGYQPVLIYEKRRTTWHIAGVELVIDELPFGLFMEIEGQESDISKAESLLNLSGAETEHASYPALTERHGTLIDGVIEARFAK